MAASLPVNTNLDNGFNFVPIPGSENQSLSIDESNSFPAALNHSESKSTIIHHDMQLDGSTNDNLQRQQRMQQEDIVPQSEPYFSTNYDEMKEQQVTTKPRKITLTKYTIYVTTHRMYIVGSNGRETVFRILEIDLTSTDKLIIMEDTVYFTRNEIMDVLNGLEETSEGGLTKKITAVGLLGFIRFTKHYYLCVVTKRRPVAILGGNYLYHIDATDLIPVTSNPKKPDRNSEELRYITTFQNIELNKTFYYSYNYDLTNSLQVNFLRNKKQSLGLIKQDLAKTFEFNDRFVWNSALLKPVFKSFDRVYDWFQPIIHGFIDQVNISIFDVHVYVTLIARRSHHFAGARFFKRGVNDTGDVANEVETEQIVSDMLTTPFHDPSAGFYNNNRYSSFVQHRGSIPLSWSQETAPNIRMTKPPINLNVVDPFYSTSALHFDDLFKRYGAPVQVLNLIKQREKTPRETKLLKQFEDCIDYLNKFLPNEKKIDYTAWDMSRASKSRGQDVIQWLENYSEKTLQKTGFFRNGLTLKTTKLQQGICRTNCIDCLDRTNTAQFVIGKRALGHQLHALGLIKEKYLEYDSDAINILTEMFHDHGDTIALQYGGSHLVNTLQTYRKINQWTSHSRDMIESVKRFYSNSFIDAQRQEAINLFLGNYVYEKGLPMLWDLNTDYYLHNNYEGVLLNYKPSYTHWYSDCYLKDQKMELVQMVNAKNKENNKDERLDELKIEKIDPYQGCFDNYWNVRYVPRELTTFGGLFEYNMNSTVRFNADQQQSSQMSHNQPKETASINSGGFISESTKNRARERIRRLTMTADDESTGNNSLTVLSELDEENYISPFKSRKPHRELKFLTFDDDDNNELKNSNDKLQENNKDNAENELKDEEISQLKFNHHQFNKLKDSHDMLVDQLISKSSKIDEHIRNSQQLPVIDIDDNSLIYNYDTLGYIEESYFDDTFIYRGDKIRNTDMTQDSNSNNSQNEDDPNEARDEGDITKELEADPLFNDLCKDYTNTLPSVTLTNLACYQTSVNIEQELKIVNANDYYFNNDETEYELIKAPGISLTSFQQYGDAASNSGPLQPVKKNHQSIPNIRRSLSPLNLLDSGSGAGITATLNGNNYHQHNDDEFSHNFNNNYNHVENNNTLISHELNDNYFSFSNNNNNNGGAHNSSSYIEDDTNDGIIVSDKYAHVYPLAGDGILQNHGHGHNSSVIIHKRKNWNDDAAGGLRNDNGLNSPFLQVNTNSHDCDSLEPNGKSDGRLYDSLLKGKKLPVLID